MLTASASEEKAQVADHDAGARARGAIERHALDVDDRLRVRHFLGILAHAADERAVLRLLARRRVWHVSAHARRRAARFGGLQRHRIARDAAGQRLRQDLAAGDLREGGALLRGDRRALLDHIGSCVLAVLRAHAARLGYSVELALWETGANLGLAERALLVLAHLGDGVQRTCLDVVGALSDRIARRLLALAHVKLALTAGLRRGEDAPRVVTAGSLGHNTTGALAALVRGRVDGAAHVLFARLEVPIQFRVTCFRLALVGERAERAHAVAEASALGLFTGSHVLEVAALDA